jgi:hypothetical protein
VGLVKVNPKTVFPRKMYGSLQELWTPLHARDRANQDSNNNIGININKDSKDNISDDSKNNSNIDSDNDIDIASNNDSDININKDSNRNVDTASKSNIDSKKNINVNSIVDSNDDSDSDLGKILAAKKKKESSKTFRGFYLDNDIVSMLDEIKAEYGKGVLSEIVNASLRRTLGERKNGL